MDDAVRRAIETIAAEHPGYDEAFEQVDAVIALFGEEQLAERVYEATLDAPWEPVAGLLAIASWSLSPAAESALFRTTESWLIEGIDRRRVSIALNLDVIPLSRPGEDERRERALRGLETRFPDLAEQFVHLIGQLGGAGSKEAGEVGGGRH